MEIIQGVATSHGSLQLTTPLTHNFGNFNTVSTTPDTRHPSAINHNHGMSLPMMSFQHWHRSPFKRISYNGHDCTQDLSHLQMWPRCRAQHLCGRGMTRGAWGAERWLATGQARGLSQKRLLFSTWVQHTAPPQGPGYCLPGENSCRGLDLQPDTPSLDCHKAQALVCL